MIQQLSRGDKQVSSWIKKSKVIQSIERLPGDASMRQYYRIRTTDGVFIVMKVAPFVEEGAEYRFLAVQRYLHSINIPVPEVYDYDARQGFVLLEDLGDQTLLHRLKSVNNQRFEKKIYEGAIDVLLSLQLNVKGAKKIQAPFFQERFTYEKLLWEVENTYDHFYRRQLSRKIRPKDKKIIFDGFGKICKTLSKQPVVLAHRDFHSRNIMVSKKGKRERMFLIDFQDARMGPAQYDLASLLKDSYYQLSETQVDSLLAYYLENWISSSKKKVSKDHFREIFDYMSIQRNFKAIGSFASFLNNRGNATYLKYIGNTFENIRRVLLRYPKFSDLREVIFYYYYF